MSEEKVGYFIVALHIVEGIFSFHSGVGQLLLSRVSLLGEKAFHTVQEAMRLSFSLFLIFFFAFWAGGLHLIRFFFGEKFELSFGLSLILITTGGSHALHRILSNFLAGMGMPQRNTITLTCEMLCLLVTVPILSSMLDEYGLACASAVSAVVALSVSSFQCFRILRCSVWDLYIIRGEDISKLFKQIKDICKA